MQTFLPYADFARSARVLDDRRLGKQRVETLQVLRALHLEDYGWSHHPAVTMWRGHTSALVAYGLAVVSEWSSRGYADRTRANIVEFVHPDPPASERDLRTDGALPPWLGWEPLHRSHRAALLRKDPGHYERYFRGSPTDLDYVWPPPPAPPDDRGRRTAWCVRTTRHDGRITVPVRGGDLGPDDTGRMTKRRRQVHRLVHEMDLGDLVVVPDGDRVHVTEISGDHVVQEDHHVRPVVHLTTIRRQDLRFPAALQDPQEVFALYDEPALDRSR